MKNRGVTLFVSMILASTLLLVAISIVALAVRESALTTSIRESQYAFYAADTALECALHWDSKNPAGGGAYTFFSTSTVGVSTAANTQMICNRVGLTNQFPVNISVSGQQATYTWPSGSNYMGFTPDPYCAKIVVTKPGDGTTRINAYGYNTCAAGAGRRVERSVEATY